MAVVGRQVKKREQTVILDVTRIQWWTREPRKRNETESICVVIGIRHRARRRRQLSSR